MEAAPRDPVKLRRTAYKLLALIVIGGLLLTYAYRLYLKGQGYRPPFVARLESNFGAVRHDLTGVGLDTLEGKVWFLTTVCVSQREQSEENIRMMKAVAAKYVDRDDLHFVCLTVDPEHDQPEVMAEFADSLGLAEDPKWWFLAAGEEPTRLFLKNKLKFGSIRAGTIEEEPKVVFDSVMGIIDPDRNLRGRYDFAAALEMQEKTQALLAEDEGGKDYSELSEEQKVAIDQNKDALGFLNADFFKALDHVLMEKDDKAKEES